MLGLAALLAAVAGSEAAAAVLCWCVDSGPQLCRARCPAVDCGECSCGMRQGTCCTFTCQPRSPDKRVLFCRALLLLHAPVALPECVHEVELVVITASCADHVAMSEISEACGFYAPAGPDPHRRGARAAARGDARAREGGGDAHDRCAAQPAGVVRQDVIRWQVRRGLDPQGVLRQGVHEGVHEGEPRAADQAER